MGGTWIIEPLSADESRVRLLHDYRAVDDDPERLAWIEQAVDRNSRSELAALKANVELATGSADLVLTFEDTVAIKGSAAGRLRLHQRGAAVVGAAAARRARPSLAEDDARPADPGDGHPRQGRLDAHDQVRPGVLPAPADRLQADRAARADDAAHRLLASRGDHRRGAR